MTAVLASRDWRDDAACRETDADKFFPEGEPSVPAVAAQVREAQTVCSTCTVRLPCLDFATVTRQAHGVWGGTSEDERNAALGHLTRGTA